MDDSQKPPTLSSFREKIGQQKSQFWEKESGNYAVGVAVQPQEASQHMSQDTKKKSHMALFIVTFLVTVVLTAIVLFSFFR